MIDNAEAYRRAYRSAMAEYGRANALITDIYHIVISDVLSDKQIVDAVLQVMAGYYREVESGD